MQLDVRAPMGWLFLILGLLLLGYGLFSDPAIYQKHSLGSNVNLHWGGVFAAFGAVCLFLARKKKA
ncbi:hypothetical protein Ga0100231_021660 [Opitutaceae bacterium TAV4]|uniref:hypothetical protein n=1 Tax=Geminisphaera colitermitum TaxID=1148786 RepID=UPI0005BE4B8A|nr:hypothetical protein [Geminisphaera colitermitum]RRJ96464.1 hypothetical protein Ga0100231_021660 [Opitutaceae bacterium TAV4]RRK01152.1 hypothetical protein Ga0100230_017280 [Opitutaceae bacterium TAV3]